MDAVLLARAQFALTIMFHFLFPPISIGLGLLVAALEAMRHFTGRDLYRRASDFWLRVFAVNFTLGVATGIVMEFQFGTNWASYSRFVGDVFGAPLAAEGVFAFFLESGFLGLLLFGRARLGSRARLFAALMVSLGTHLSAFWILVANSWMQTPAGFEIVNGRAVLTDFGAAVFNPSMLPRFSHTVFSSWACGAFLMAGIAAWHLRRASGSDVMRLSLRLGIVAALASTLLVGLSGHHHARQVAHTQPVKFAAMEGLYSTQHGAPLVIFSLPPSQDSPARGPELALTRMTSFLAFGSFDAPVRGLDEWPREDWPPVTATFLTFHNMVLVGVAMVVLAGASVLLLWHGSLETSRLALLALVLAIPLPHVAIQLGWAAAEIGRQPWIVSGVLRTRDAVSRVVSAPEIVTSLVIFGLMDVVLGAVWLYLMAKAAKREPEGAAAEVAETADAAGLLPQEA
jgi:cytochrome d ubiquinol oxidase subunit I